jgi:hypothetical protein
MKKILKAALVILVMAACGPGAWASPDAKPHPQLTRAQVDQLRAEQKQRHQKKAKIPTRKVDGKALRGAKRVSPDPVKNHF